MQLRYIEVAALSCYYPPVLQEKEEQEAQQILQGINYVHTTEHLTKNILFYANVFVHK